MIHSRKSHNRHSRIETLESRQVPATGITASLSAGVLSITGTPHSDNILISETNGMISIFGLSKSWNAAQVNSLNIKLGTSGKAGGNDYVSLNSVANGGNQILAKNVTVTSSKGSDRVTLSDGADVYFSGLGRKLTVAAGVAKLNGHVVDAPPSTIGDYVWNDANGNGIQDANETGLAGVTLTLTGSNANGSVTDHATTDANGHYSFTEIAGSYTITVDASNFTSGVLAGYSASPALSGGNRSVDSNGVNDAASVTLAPGANDFTVDFGFYVPALVPPTQTWFDSHIQTAAIRTLADADYQDGVLGRNDMIGLLRAVEQAGPVTAAELSDLTSILDNTSLFGSLDYVRVLSQDIVLGNAANAHYQGAALGNLAIGFSAAKLEDLVDKWFLGTDLPVGTSDWTDANGQDMTFSYRQVSGSLFVNGVSYTDVRQGGIGDCYFLSSLAETALKNPSAITSMFTVNGDGTYTVRFMNGSKADYVTVNSELPTDANGYLVFDGMGQQASSSSNELWVALAEKAYVQMNESGWIRAGMSGSGMNVYNAISGGYMFMALNQITGQSTVIETGTAVTGFTMFANLFNAGKEICLGSENYPTDSQIVGDHAYAVLSVDTVHDTVTVFNPWGIDNGHDSGIITLTWSQLVGSFGYFDRTA
ncbi:MAG TPA: SdrD B-like domain-containing protein [Pirellulales bacterium]|nr:SdrD B-like domain-containing protein [Pirellulales bacterium]